MNAKLQDLIIKANQRHCRCTDERYGQSLMNALYDIDSVKYMELVGTEFDCFYKDENAEHLINKLEKDWENS